MTWLLESRVKAGIEHAEATGYTPTADQQTQFMLERDGQDVLTTAGNQAQVSVSGVLTKTPSFLARVFGGGNTTYADISDALTRADADPSVAGINLRVDSPGGTFDGLFGLIATMQSVKKPITAHVDGLAASAAYAIVSQADKIVARDKSARFGSIGVAATVPMPSQYSKDITSTDAPKKRPDVSTDEGVAAVREELDAMHDLFVDTIAAGRGTTVKKVNSTYGQGACLLAEAALKLGMIDAIGDSTPETNAAPSGKPETRTMDLATLQAQHPATFAAAVQQGVDQERDRVSAHAIMGQESGDMATAMTAIKEGTIMTATLQATYMAAGMSKRDIAARQQDEPSADNVDPSAPQTSQADAVAALVAQRMGVKV